MSTLWETFGPKTEEVVPTTHGWLLNATWLLPGVPLGIGWPTACFLCLTVACYLTVFRLVRWNRATRNRLEENLDRLVTMKQFSDLTDQHQRVRTQMNHQVHMYGLLDEEIDRLKDEAKTLLKTVASAERSLLPERLRLRDLQEQQERDQQQQPRHKLPSAIQQQQQRRRRPAAVQRLRQRPHATSSAPTSLPASAHARCEPAPAPAAASTTAAVNAGAGAASTGALGTGASGGNGCQPPPAEE